MKLYIVRNMNSGLVVPSTIHGVNFETAYKMFLRLEGARIPAGIEMIQDY